MRRATHVHEAHHGHFRHHSGASLAREEPATPLVPEDFDEALERASVHALQRFRYFASDGQPSPGLRNRSFIHFATLLGSSAPVMAPPMMTISGSASSTASRVSGPNPPASATRKPRRRISETASICAVDRSPATRMSVGEWTPT